MIQIVVVYKYKNYLVKSRAKIFYVPRLNCKTEEYILPRPAMNIGWFYLYDFAEKDKID